MINQLGSRDRDYSFFGLKVYMGIWCYLINHTRREYTGSVWKMNEYQLESICSKLGWDSSKESIDVGYPYDEYVIPDAAPYVSIPLPLSIK